MNCSSVKSYVVGELCAVLLPHVVCCKQLRVQMIRLFCPETLMAHLETTNLPTAALLDPVLDLKKKNES